MKTIFCLPLCVPVLLSLVLIGDLAKAQQGITTIYTDYNGYWTSSSTAISPVKPDNSHNLLGFTWNGQNFSTGVNDAVLTSHGIVFNPQNYQAFPVRNITLTGSLIGFGQLKDGVDNGPSVPQPFTLPANISAFLTDGLQGLNIGSGVANVPTGTVTFDFGSIIDPSKIGDGIPDILVSQIASPSAAFDSVYFTNAAGVLVGNRIAIQHTAPSVPSVGNWTADFYNLDGSLSAGFTKTDRPIRVWATDLSAFGITAANYTNAVTLRYKLNGTSDPAFLAFNSSLIQVISANDDDTATNLNTAVAIKVLANDVPAAALSPASMIITSAAVHGTTSINPATGVITYTPTTGFSGIDQFSYQVCNGNATPQCDEAVVTVRVGTVDLAVTKTVDTAFAFAGNNVVFTVTAKNNSAYAGLGVVVMDPLPAGYTYVSSVAGAGTYTPGTGKWNIGTLAAGANKVLTITAKANATGAHTNTATISGTLPDPDLTNNSASAATTVLTVPVGTPVFAAGATSARCEGSGITTYTATATNTSGITYSLSPLSAGSIGTTTGTLTWNAGFNGTAVVTASANGLAGPKTATHTITVNPTPSLVVTNPAAVCAPASVNLTAAAVTAGSSPTLTLAYFQDPALTTALPGPDSIKTSGTFYIQGTSAAGCISAAAPVTATINPKPALSVSASDSEVCKGTTVTLSGTSPGNIITWTEAVGSNPVNVHPAINVYYHATATTPFGCSTEDSIQVKVDSFRVKLAATPNPVLAGTTLTLTTSANFTYGITSWLPAIDFADQTALSQTLTVRDTARIYSVIARSGIGCTDTTTLRVAIDVNLKDFFIPNAFSPNGDGRNDQFMIYGSSVQSVDLAIYNQWGELVFRSARQGGGWDGTWNGRPQQTGNYVYVAKVTFYNNQSIRQRGMVHLIR